MDADYQNKTVMHNIKSYKSRLTLLMQSYFRDNMALQYNTLFLLSLFSCL